MSVRINLSKHQVLLELSKAEPYSELETLLQSGADPDCRDSEGNTPVINAARSDNLGAVNVLLRYDADVNLCNEQQRSALMESAKKGHVSLVTRLVDAGGALNGQDREGCTPLSIAARHGRTEVVEALLATGQCDVDKPNKWGQTPLHYAAKSGHTGIVAVLTFTGANQDAQDRWSNTPLMYATLHGQSSIVWFLVQQAKCDVNMVNTGRRTALHTAAQNGHQNIVSTLIKSGAKLDLQDSEEATAVLLSGRFQHCQIMRSLISAGCDVTLTDKFGKSVFHFAVSNGYEDIVDTLLDTGLDPDISDCNGTTPFIRAVRANHLHIAKKLLQYNCDVRRSCRLGGRVVPVLAIVLRNGSVELLSVLLEAGCDTSCFLPWLYCNRVSHKIRDDQALISRIQEIISTPRSLQQMARDTARRHLSYRIQDELEQLALPSKLKKYIAMRDIEFPELKCVHAGDGNETNE